MSRLSIFRQLQKKIACGGQKKPDFFNKTIPFTIFVSPAAYLIMFLIGCVLNYNISVFTVGVGAVGAGFWGQS